MLPHKMFSFRVFQILKRSVPQLHLHLLQFNIAGCATAEQNHHTSYPKPLEK